ncbi:MAG: endonuclease III [bacterium]
MKQDIIKKIIELLSKKYPEPKTELIHKTPFELLIATILSAQSTDKQVNTVTAKLFKKFNKPEDFIKLSKTELEKYINSIGLFRNKSKYIIESSKIIIDKFKGKVPDNRQDLMKLPGVGRKTANVVLGCAFNKNTFAVDTHVFRVSNRIGLVNSDNVSKVEKELMLSIPEEKWVDMHHYLIFHGRQVCKARNPDCQKCCIKIYCKYSLS